MNRFRKNKKSKNNDKHERAATPESPSALSFSSSFKSKKGKKSQEQPPEIPPPPAIDFSLALPSDDDFRTSLIMPKLSARFSMLREQSDPASKIGKASDDSVLSPNRMSNRMSRLLLNQMRTPLADIDEVASNIERDSVVRTRAGSLTESSYGIDDDNFYAGSNGSVMNRPRPIEGNRFFSGRQEVYKITVNPASGRSSGNKRAIDDNDLTEHAFLRHKCEEYPVSRPDVPRVSDVSTPVHEYSEDSSSNISANRTTYSSTASGPRGSTAATSLDEPQQQQVQQQHNDQSSTHANPIPNSIPKTDGPKPAPGNMIRGASLRTRRLYGKGLAQEHQEHESCTLLRLNSLTRHPAPGPEPSRGLNRSFSRSATGLHERLRNLAIAESADADTSSCSSPSSVLPRRPRGQSDLTRDISPFSPGAAAAAAAVAANGSYGSTPPLSPPTSDFDDTGPTPLAAAVKPEDRGKATALGLFNRPKAPYDESQFINRQLQLRKNAPTPPMRRHTPADDEALLRKISSTAASSARSTGISTTSGSSRAESTAASHNSGMSSRPSVQRSTSGTRNVSPVRKDSMPTFFNSSESDSEGEDVNVRPTTAQSFTSKDPKRASVRSTGSGASFATAGSTTISPTKSNEESSDRLPKVSFLPPLNLYSGEQFLLTMIRLRNPNMMLLNPLIPQRLLIFLPSPQSPVSSLHLISSSLKDPIRLPWARMVSASARWQVSVTGHLPFLPRFQLVLLQNSVQLSRCLRHYHVQIHRQLA